jgi:hypothetical protein
MAKYGMFDIQSRVDAVAVHTRRARVMIRLGRKESMVCLLGMLLYYFYGDMAFATSVHAAAYRACMLNLCNSMDCWVSFALGHLCLSYCDPDLWQHLFLFVCTSIYARNVNEFTNSKSTKLERLIY